MSNRRRRGRSEGGIGQLASGRWYGDLSLGCDGEGKRIRRRVYGITKKEVLDELDKLKQQSARGPLPDAGSLSVTVFLDQWLVAAEPTVARGTCASYRQHVKNLIKPRLGGVRLAKLSAL